MHSRKITVAEMAPHIHNFSYGENKVDKISEWLINWIKKSLKEGKINYFDFLPSKAELAFHIGVSKGTIQNVFRKVEDSGLIISKQKVGSYIKNPNVIFKDNKLTSKRELASEKIKNYILEKKLNKGDVLISIRELARCIKISNATARTAIETLVSEKILIKSEKFFIVNSINFEAQEISQKTLVQKIADNIKESIILKNTGTKEFPTNVALAKKYNVSIKTIHDATKILAREGIIQSRRGKYGTQIITNDAKNRELYNYERIELKIRQYISSQCSIGAKLPPINELAKFYNVSTKTVRKALDNLQEEGYLTFVRGRYGGTFVTDIPQEATEAYKWLAINPQFVKNTNK